MNIGISIKTVRQAQGVQQQELSMKIFLSQTSLSQIENGLKRPNKKTLNKISRELKIPESLLYILGLEESDIPSDRKLLFKHLYPAIKGLILEIATHEDKR